MVFTHKDFVVMRQCLDSSSGHPSRLLTSLLFFVLVDIINSFIAALYLPSGMIDCLGIALPEQGQL